ncbi:MAG TPA: SDR family NAD(P)-dependent oxidoreductase [Anaerolineae bacterium]|nr:SDR family NAD(P)-dependent oxidoreductase [Anaerolineae bacterium]
MMDLTGRVVMVTGASGNLGAAVARGFQAAGAHLALADRAADRLPSLFPDLAASPQHMLCGAVDATDPDSVQQWVDAAIARFGRIDVLANTIGGYKAGAPTHETTLETWDFMMDLNARTAFIISRAVLPQMLRQGAGRIIHTAARAALAGTANHSAYNASKSVVVRLVESMAAEYKQQGITVNCVLPGTIDTPQNRADMPNADWSKWVPPAAIADVFVFLASDAASHVMGATIPVYGRS